MSTGAAEDRSAGNSSIQGRDVDDHAGIATTTYDNPGARASVDHGMPSAPEVHLNGRPASSMSGRKSITGSVAGSSVPGEGWGANFWVTLVDPQVPVDLVSCRRFRLTRETDASVILCMSRHRRGQLGSTSWELLVSSCCRTFDAAVNCQRRLPPNPEGEWWEMIDESSGIPYYYHTKSGETVWERPDAFVIPLGILQVRRSRPS